MKLCYIDQPWAYFTTQELSKQWGDDWDDAPYEYNAGEPYEYNPKHDQGPPWQIIKIAFEGDYFRTPCDGQTNSPWSVKQINSQAVAWLYTVTWYNHPAISILAGTNIYDFIKLIYLGQGKVYVPIKYCPFVKFE